MAVTYYETGTLSDLNLNGAGVTAPTGSTKILQTAGNLIGGLVSGRPLDR